MAGDHRNNRATNDRSGLDLLLAFLIVAVGAASTAVYAWTRPAERPMTLQYAETGQLSYAAAVPRASVYGPAGLQTGEPIYSGIAPNVRIRYAYSFNGPPLSRARGSERLVVAVSNGEGVTRQIPLQARTTFRGSHFVTTALLRLAQIEAVAKAFDAAAGAGPQTSYNVTISPLVRLQGSYSGSTIRTTLDQSVAFSYGGGTLIPSGAASARGAGGTSRNSFATVRPGSAVLPVLTQTKLFLGLPVTWVRIGSLVLLALALIAGLVVGRRPLSELASRDQRTRLSARYVASLVRVDRLPPTTEVAVVELSSFEGLLRVGRRLECPVLHRPGDGEVYAVVDNGTMYRFSPDGVTARDTSLPPSVLELTRLNGAAHPVTSE